MLFVNPSPLFLSHSRIGTRPSLRTPERSSQQACRLPSAVTVDHDLEGAIPWHRLQLHRPLQRGRHASVGVHYGRFPREAGVFDPSAFPVHPWVPRSSLGTSGVDSVAQNRFGPLQSPILPGDGHRLDPRSCLCNAAQRPRCAAPKERRPWSVECPESTRTKTARTAFDGDRQLERVVAQDFFHRPVTHRDAVVNGKRIVRVRALLCDADQRSTQRKHNVFRTWETWEKRRVCQLSGADSAACLLPVQRAKHRESTTLPIRRRTR